MCIRDRYAPVGDDCNDQDATISPDGTESCDGVDQDCNGLVDDNASGAPTWYADLDTDGYGDASTGVTDCLAPTGKVADATDCDDSAATIDPASPEHCD